MAGSRVPSGRALLLPLLALGAWVQTAAQQDLTLRFGVSISQTGSIPNDYNTGNGNTRCWYCPEAEKGLRLWAEKVNSMDFRTQGGRRMRVQLDVRDDKGRSWYCEDNYRRMVPVTDLFLGPSYVLFNEGVKTIAEQNSKVLILWSFNTMLYNPPPFVTDSRTHAEWHVENKKLLAEQNSWGGVVVGRLLTDLPSDDNASSPTSPGSGPWQGLQEAEAAQALGKADGDFACAFEDGEGCSPNRTAPRAAWRDSGRALAWLSTHRGLVPPREVGVDPQSVSDWYQSNGAPAGLAAHLAEALGQSDAEDPERRLQTLYGQSRFTFDSNIPDVARIHPAIDELYARGARVFVFVVFSSLPGGPMKKEAAKRYAAYVRAKGGTMAWSLTCDASTLFGFCGNLLAFVQADVVVHCGGVPSAFAVYAVLSAFKISAHAYVLDQPSLLPMDNMMASVKLHSIEVSPVQELVGDRPDDVFGSLDGFVKDYKDFVGGKMTPGFGALSLTSAAIILLQALRLAPGTDATSVASYLKGIRDGESFPHMMGPYYFDDQGNRKGGKAGFRQIFSLPVASSTRADRNELVRVKDISADALAACLSTNGGHFASVSDCETYIASDIFYPAADWITRSVTTALCVPGCVPNSGHSKLAGGMLCRPCPAGQFHSWQDQACRPCAPGEFADVPGMSSCKPCPVGARCNDPSHAPIAQKTYFRMRIARGQTYFGCDVEQGPNLSTFIYVKCIPHQVCAGPGSQTGCLESNTGMGCGQCSTGYTFQGIASGARVCKRCPSFYIVVGFLTCFIVSYGTLTMYFAHLGYNAAFGPGYLPITLARASLHYVHLLGIAFEVTKMDSKGFTGYLLVPIDILYRPLDLLMLDCIDQEIDSFKSIGHMAYYYWYIMVAGYGGITAMHILLYFSNFVKNSISAFVTFLRLRRRPKASNEEEEEMEEEEDAEEEEEAAAELAEDHSTTGASMELAPDHVSENSSLSSDSNDKPHTWSILAGPGLAYTELHESLAIEVKLKSSLIRCFLAWTLAIYPVYLRGTSRMFACERFDNMQRMVLNYDIVCDTEQSIEATKGTSLPGIPNHLYSYIICIIVPGALALSLKFYGGDKLRTIQSRRRSAVLFDGFQPDMAWWEVLMFARTGILIVAADNAQPAVRIMILLFVLVISFGAQFFVRPFQTCLREAIHVFELFALIGVMLVLMVGQIEQIVPDQQGWLVNIGIIVCLLYNLSVFIYGFFIIFVSRVSGDIEAIIEAGSTISVFTRRVHRLVQLFPGVSPVYYYREGDVNLIDISHLTGFEKTSFARMVKDTVSVCIDCSDKFKTWVVERAINEAFRRAMDARQAKLRHIYEQHGTHTFHKWKVFSLSLRAPDIPPRSDECEAALAVASEQAKCAVSVDELNQALLDVSYDVINYHPSIFGLAVEEHRRKSSKRKVKSRSVQAAKEWGSQVLSVDSMMRELGENKNAASSSSSSSSSGSGSSSGEEDENGEEFTAKPEDLQPWDWVAKQSTINSKPRAGSVESLPVVPLASMAEMRLSNESFRTSTGSFRDSLRRGSSLASADERQGELLEVMKEDTMTHQNTLHLKREAEARLQEQLAAMDQEYEELKMVYVSSIKPGMDPDGDEDDVN